MIYTLYSFKGGVGRSMALANIAECFFQRGLRVLMIDWDLEAPGLENYFYFPASPENPESELARVSGQPGLMDLLLEYKKKYPEIARQVQPETAGTGTREAVATGDERALFNKRAAEIQKVAEITAEFLKNIPGIPEELQKIDVPVVSPSAAAPSRSFTELLEATLRPIELYLQSVHKSSTAELSLLTAGSRTPQSFAAYAEAVQDFDWLEFLAAYSGREFLEWLRRRLLSIADVVLIDSRTGVTEMGGICTRQMADAVISFCAPNFQNLNGVTTVVGSLDTDSAKKARFDRELQVLVIPTRIDDFESGLLDQFSKQFSAQIEHDPFVPDVLKQTERPLWNLQIPYIPKYNYREQRVIGPGAAPPDPATEKLVKAYTNISLHLALLAPESSPIRDAFSSEIATAFPYLQPAKPPRMVPTVPAGWVERDVEFGQLKTALISSSTAPVQNCIAVCGGAGVGKTSLVSRVCQDEDVVRAFPDGIVWLALDRPWDSKQLAEFLRTSFALPQRAGPEAVALTLENRRFLFIVDNVVSDEQLVPLSDYGRRKTLVILTRDSSIATRYASTVVSVGLFSPEQAGSLLKSRPDVARAGPDLDILLRWPLGASLLRADLERRLAQGEDPAEAWAGIVKAIELHGITAFDQPGASNRSVALSIRDSIGRLSADERNLLIASAKIAEGLPLPAGDSVRDPQIQHLNALGLTKVSEGKILVDPVIRAWLLSQGYIESGTRGRKLDRQQTIQRGYAIVRGLSASLEETRDLAEKAVSIRSFSLARRLFALARQHPQAVKLDEKQRLKLVQRQALCTYKDDDLASNERFSRAIETLQDGDLSSPSPSQETLGLAGAIFKGLWKLTGLRSNLERSLSFYRRGAEQDFQGDFGYTRINAAFVLDLLSYQDEPDSPGAKQRRQEATTLREEIVKKLPDLASQRNYSFLKQQWWYGATLAEACFGLGRHTEARYWIREALALDPPDWQLESTTRQMVNLAHAKGWNESKESPAWQMLSILVGDATPAIHAIVNGKVGLALSGGGFRASLFHIGVLARLAELDMLRHVEVLSCVSGGSIIGAHYYLEIRRLLRSKPDRDITREDYIEIVKRIEGDFLAGVQKNLRTRLFAGWRANVRSIFQPGYTRTKYLGELFERYLYRPSLETRKPVWLNELRIDPAEGVREFNPKLDNWRRAAKAPILLLNATALNTGHNWQFAVSWMGEPPLGASTDVDRNDLLRRMYYSDAPSPYQRVRLGEAVAASACVPGLFDPVELRLLYPRRTIRLVDGGVHDNQGISGLHEQECEVVIVSDASGQMNSDRAPSAGAFFVALRSNSILMSRVRESQFRELVGLRSADAMPGVLFLHLKKDLDVSHVDWIGCQDPFAASPDSRRPTSVNTLTSYGVPKTIQECLSGLRTDLDSFSDAEAYALMLSGYRMASSELPRCFPFFVTNPASPEPWKFLSIAPAVDRLTDREPDHDLLLTWLKVGESKAFKAWRIGSAAARMVPELASLVILVVISIMAIPRITVHFGLSGLFNLDKLAHPLAIPVTAILAVAAAISFLLLRREKTITVVVSGLFSATVGWLLARIHLWIVDPAFLESGARLSQPDPSSRGNAMRNSIRRYALSLLAAVAVFAYVKLPTRSPGDSIRDRARAELQSSQWAAALNEYHKIDPTKLTLDDLRGEAWALRESGKVPDAIQLYQQILMAAPKDSRTIADLAYAKAMSAGPTAEAEKIVGRINIQLADPSQEATYAQLKSLLENLGFTVLPEEVVGPNRSPRNAQVRYFDHTDDASAERITEVLKLVGISAKAIHFPRYETLASRGTFEIWLPLPHTPAK